MTEMQKFVNLSKKQAGAELGQAQIKLNDIVEVVVIIVVIAVAKAEV